MNKYLILLAVIALSCGNTVSKSAIEPKSETNIELEGVQKDMLIGEFQKEELQQKPFSAWFTPRYNKFSPETDAMATIKISFAV